MWLACHRASWEPREPMRSLGMRMRTKLCSLIGSVFYFSESKSKPSSNRICDGGDKWRRHEYLAEALAVSACFVSRKQLSKLVCPIVSGTQISVISTVPEDRYIPRHDANQKY